MMFFLIPEPAQKFKNIINLKSKYTLKQFFVQVQVSEETFFNF